MTATTNQMPLLLRKYNVIEAVAQYYAEKNNSDVSSVILKNHSKLLLSTPIPFSTLLHELESILHNPSLYHNSDFLCGIHSLLQTVERDRRKFVKRMHDIVSQYLDSAFPRHKKRVLDIQDQLNEDCVKKSDQLCRTYFESSMLHVKIQRAMLAIQDETLQYEQGHALLIKLFPVPDALLPKVLADKGYIKETTDELVINYQRVRKQIFKFFDDVDDYKSLQSSRKRKHRTTDSQSFSCILVDRFSIAYPTLVAYLHNPPPLECSITRAVNQYVRATKKNTNIMMSICGVLDDGTTRNGTVEESANQIAPEFVLYKILQHAYQHSEHN